MSGERRELEPHDRLTRIAAAMIEAQEAHAEHGEEKAIVMLADGREGGIGLSGYDDGDSEAMADMFIHLRAIFRANGKELLLAPLGGDG